MNDLNKYIVLLGLLAFVATLLYRAQKRQKQQLESANKNIYNWLSDDSPPMWEEVSRSKNKNGGDTVFYTDVLTVYLSERFIVFKLRRIDHRENGTIAATHYLLCSMTAKQESVMILSEISESDKESPKENRNVRTTNEPSILEAAKQSVIAGSRINLTYPPRYFYYAAQLLDAHIRKISPNNRRRF